MEAKEFPHMDQSIMAHGNSNDVEHGEVGVGKSIRGFLKAYREEGLATFAQHQDEIDLVVLDMIMPRMNGRECFFRLRELAPELPVLLASGFAQSSDLAELQKAGLSGLLRKPFNTLDLSRAVYAALQGRT